MNGSVGASVPPLPRVLSIAGTDPTGGAGVQADLKSIAAQDGYGMAVVTALVAQNTLGVRSVHVPDTVFLRQQLDAVSDDVTIDAVKTGMLGTAQVVRVVVDWLRAHRPAWVVVDPVMVATSGDRLLDADAESAMADLFALADLVTPNRDELRVLAQLAGAQPNDAIGAARAVARRWDVRVLAKGGHDDGPTADDALVSPDGSVRVFSGPRIATTNTHGTGCSLSSAIATLVARHGDWELAVGAAKTWLAAALRGADALQVGQGHGPIDHNALVRAALPTPRLTDAWWVDAAAVLDETLDCRFLRGLADGTLDPEVFAGYLAQDVHYLRAYEQHLATIAAGSTGDAATFWTTASEGCAAEARDLHQRRLAGSHADDPVHPVCAGYLAHLADAARQSAESGDVSILAAAVLPCFRVYAWVGERLGTAPVGHPFADWITAYRDPGFAASSARATELVEELARRADPELRGRMVRAFRQSVAQELAFFRMPERLGEPV
ncbi:bifunctional hydroxymethylpyrimidine kinase/phosphomethylpyrimidine kinase [Curtobacterium herbarum]|uniref:Hydroxymethylpyrimidine kinase n=1 Tax=Curtobacterium herbarum TaxID=150122 RepID=A0ABN1ZCJ1_9MICO|nr:bifunctional hydroxymethylpyrimidine kinase/phosphomethylpyrimidine kinase [Curtobacterium herbarum]MBM7475822.1 hydroxymethylpyrimidine/phosphomethylpyrimidine kinase/hydroxymethylpyrimidine kinase/phosphomethylpyrimidine kinase/thiamine-phosphate diphosphorylase [Curtobacterium herbarum]MCS6543732.1 bifunctional hydroxymethylpyrimidine kinase/phosphomethylpyrimidine kinase [Curtobacterium herbarum]